MTNKLPPMKKGTSSGVYRTVQVSSKSTINNYYTEGSGVGATSIATRRALRRRASWRPTNGGLSSTHCKGHCLNNNLFMM